MAQREYSLGHGHRHPQLEQRGCRARRFRPARPRRLCPGAKLDRDNDLYPLGLAFTCGAATSCTPAAGLKFTPPNDGRLRKAFATTFFIRNSTR